jgi:hypothetical protein
MDLEAITEDGKDTSMLHAVLRQHVENAPRPGR